LKQGLAPQAPLFSRSGAFQTIYRRVTAFRRDLFRPAETHESPLIFEEQAGMKLIVAVIRPEKLEAVQRALNERDVYLMTVSDVRGCGRQRGFTEQYRGTEFRVNLLPKLKLEIAVNDAFVEAAIEAIVHAARVGETGQIGDGKIFVLPLEDCVRIRTGERGGQAIGP
jgi:nitrogen regulatory protein P-II 2